jgi:hypothetical protein
MKHNHTNESHHMPAPSGLKKFMPLIGIFALITAFTLWRYAVANDPALFSLMRDFMGAFFVVFGGFKVINWKGSVDAYQMYDIIAKQSRLYGYLYPLIELSLGVAYFTVVNLFWVNIITLIVMVVGIVGVAKKLAEHEVVPCACLGAVFKIPMTKITLLEDTLMAAMAGGMLIM